jgi:hypothetical protein
VGDVVAWVVSWVGGVVVSDVALPWEEGAVDLEVVAVDFALAVVSESIYVSRNIIVAV